MLRRFTTALLVLLVLAGCGTPDDLVTLTQPAPPPSVAQCKTPVGTPTPTATPFSYPGPGTPMPTYPVPTVYPTTDPQSIPEETAPGGLGSAPGIQDEAAALGAFMVMPDSVDGHPLEAAQIGPLLMEQGGSMRIGYGRRAGPFNSAEPIMQLVVSRGYDLLYPWHELNATVQRDGPIIWSATYQEVNYPDEHGQNQCYPFASLRWAVQDSGLVFEIITASVEHRDALLRAYLKALKNAPPMRDTTPPPSPTATPTPFGGPPPFDTASPLPTPPYPVATDGPILESTATPTLTPTPAATPAP